MTLNSLIAGKIEQVLAAKMISIHLVRVVFITLTQLSVNALV